MKYFQKSNRTLTPTRGVTVALIALTTGFAMPAIAADYVGGQLGIERQKVERPQGGQQAERRPDRQVERRQERHADRQHNRREDRIERYEERRYADRHERHRAYRAPAWRGDIHRFDRHDMPRWRGGSWRHARHQGQLGWWWVVGGSWYFYSQPVYPYPDPYTPYYYAQPEPQVVVIESERIAPTPEIVVAPQEASPSWYFCVSTQGYYPYTPSCPEGWVSVPATPAPAR